MRIRKRLATAIPDLQLQLRSLEAAAAAAAPSPDPPIQPPDRSCRSWVFAVHDQTDDHKIKQKELGDDDETWIMEANKSATDDIREIVNICNRDEEGGSNKTMHSSSSCAHEENKLVPLKKRKGSFERSPSEDTLILLSAKMKSKTNNKCDDHNNNNNNNNNTRDHDENESNSGSSTTKKKMKRGNVIMEGSRCSRINGRGWRCHHPTLVGYSLCEHHLGKGRLRNVQKPTTSKNMVTKKRTKVGVVKARSMSSLLSQI